MVQLTVAIPTLRRWNFLQKTLPILLDNDLIAYVVISDETGEDVKQIQTTSYASNPKLRLSTNTEILGMYRNKRRCLELAPTEWVAVLDSDNVFPEAFFETIHDELEKADPKTIYASAHIVRLFLKTGQSEERTEHFSGKRITKSTWNETLQTRAWNFLLNDGNWIGHKSLLEAWPLDIPESKIKATDSLMIVRNAVLAGFTYYVVPGLRYIHTVHDDSEWIKTEQMSSFLLATTTWTI
jgi:glycosyltransferase involved in cell wall biosynthesis